MVCEVSLNDVLSLTALPQILPTTSPTQPATRGCYSMSVCQLTILTWKYHSYILLSKTGVSPYGYDYHLTPSNSLSPASPTFFTPWKIHHILCRPTLRSNFKEAPYLEFFPVSLYFGTALVLRAPPSPNLTTTLYRLRVLPFRTPFPWTSINFACSHLSLQPKVWHSVPVLPRAYLVFPMRNKI